MRIAVISDIHGNYFALEAALDDIRRNAVDEIVCLGDAATIGFQPLQVLRELRDRRIACVLGNHDAALLDLNRAVEYQVAPPLLPTLHWCAAQLSQADFDYLRSFQRTLAVSLDGAEMFCFHGSPASFTELILASAPAEKLDEMFSRSSAGIFTGGHSHIQMLCHHKGKILFNPGSIGSAFREPPAPNAIPALLPWAEYAIVSVIGKTVSVDLRRVPFDVEAFTNDAARSDIPIRDWWLQQYPHG